MDLNDLEEEPTVVKRLSDFRRSMVASLTSLEIPRWKL